MADLCQLEISSNNLSVIHCTVSGAVRRAARGRIRTDQPATARFALSASRASVTTSGNSTAQP